MARDSSEKQNQFYTLQTPKGAAKSGSDHYCLQEPTATSCLQKETKEISP